MTFQLFRLSGLVDQLLCPDVDLCLLATGGFGVEKRPAILIKTDIYLMRDVHVLQLCFRDVQAMTHQDGQFGWTFIGRFLNRLLGCRPGGRICRLLSSVQAARVAQLGPVKCHGDWALLCKSVFFVLASVHVCR